LRAPLAVLRILGWAQPQVNVQKLKGFGFGEFRRILANGFREAGASRL